MFQYFLYLKEKRKWPHRFFLLLIYLNPSIVFKISFSVALILFAARYYFKNNSLSSDQFPETALFKNTDREFFVHIFSIISP